MHTAISIENRLFIVVVEKKFDKRYAWAMLLPKQSI